MAAVLLVEKRTKQLKQLKYKKDLRKVPPDKKTSWGKRETV